MRAGRWVPAAAMLAVLPSLAGCLGLTGKPPKQLVRLSTENPAPVQSSVISPLGTAIVVGEPDGDRSLSAPRIPVQVDDTTVAYLKDATWLEKPAREFRRVLAETLRGRSKVLVFEDDELGASGRVHLTGRLNMFGYDARSRAVVVQFDAIRQVIGEPTTEKRFEERVPNVEPVAGTVVPALNHAANLVAQDVAAWMLPQGN